jgi:hypothetical protein
MLFLTFQKRDILLSSYILQLPGEHFFILSDFMEVWKHSQRFGGQAGSVAPKAALYVSKYG